MFVGFERYPLSVCGFAAALGLAQVRAPMGSWCVYEPGATFQVGAVPSIPLPALRNYLRQPAGLG